MESELERFWDAPCLWTMPSDDAPQPLLQDVVSTDAHKERMLLLMKVLYFLNGFSASSFGRFATLFYIDHGLDTQHIGIVEFAQPMCSAVGNQLFGLAADRLQRKKPISIGARVVSTALLMALPLPDWLGLGSASFSYILVVMVTMAFFGVGGGVLDS